MERANDRHKRLVSGVGSHRGDCSHCVVHWFRSQRRGVGLSVTLCSERCIELQVGRERLSFLGDWEKEREREPGERTSVTISQDFHPCT